MANYPSSLVQQGIAPSIIPGTMKPVVGRVTLPAGVTLQANDVLQLFYLSTGGGASIFSVYIGTPALDSGATLTVSLVDSLTPTPTTIIAPSNTFRAGGVLTDANVGQLTIGDAVTYTTPNLIRLLVVAGAGAAIPAGGAVVYFNFGCSSR